MLFVFALERGIVNFSRSSSYLFHTAEDLALASRNTLKATQTRHLIDEGVVFAMGDDIATGERTFVATYEDAVLARGTAGEMEEALKPLMGKRGKGLANAIDNIVSSPKYWKKYTFDDLMNGKLPCFAAGTLVRTENGLKPIEKITVGENVLSHNMKTHENEWKTVIETFTNYAEKWVELHVRDTKITATGMHLFWLPESSKWENAKNLVKDDRLLSNHGNVLTISHVEIVEKREPSYNLEVADNHNYYVSENEVLTHNAARTFRYSDQRQYEFIHYLLKEQGKELYVGITAQELHVRFSQHVQEGKRALNGIKPQYKWKAGRIVADYINFPAHLKDTPVKPLKMTFFEARVIEAHELQIRGGKGVLKNTSLPMSKTSFNKWKHMGNPCRFFV